MWEYLQALLIGLEAIDEHLGSRQIFSLVVVSHDVLHRRNVLT
jgi:hypothetical protein